MEQVTLNVDFSCIEQQVRKIESTIWLLYRSTVYAVYLSLK